MSAKNGNHQGAKLCNCTVSKMKKFKQEYKFVFHWDICEESKYFV